MHLGYVLCDEPSHGRRILTELANKPVLERHIPPPAIAGDAGCYQIGGFV